MKKHIVDTPGTRHDDGRLKAYTKVEREAKPSEATLALQRRKRDDAPKGRTKAFTKIERSGG